MPVPLTIQNTTFNYPVQGEDPQWGQEATDWAQAVTDVLATLLGVGDILQTTVTINNNVAIAINVNGLLFDPSLVRAANINYSVYRTSSTNTSGFSEEGTIYIIYDNNAASGSKWTLSQRTNGNSGVVFTITDLGQVQYTSSDIGTTTYSGTMKFAAKALST